jgi:hypothetical protein
MRIARGRGVTSLSCVAPAQVSMINNTKKDYSAMSLLALEHISHVCETQAEVFKPQLLDLGETRLCSRQLRMIQAVVVVAID